LSALPDDVVLSVEVPLPAGASPEPHARRVFAAARRLFEALREEE